MKLSTIPDVKFGPDGCMYVVISASSKPIAKRPTQSRTPESYGEYASKG